MVDRLSAIPALRVPVEGCSGASRMLCRQGSECVRFALIDEELNNL
jgi:hypothetical protein